MRSVIARLWLRSGSTHSNLALAVEVRWCPRAHCDPELAVAVVVARRRRRRRRRKTLIASNSPHLAGGEKH